LVKHADDTVTQRDDANRRSKVSSHEGERWWLGALTYGGGVLTTVLVAAVVIAMIMEELWIALAAAAVVALAAFVVWSFLNGDSWWN
jgi:VIT1/CCC1 family predicted Fe2+/Mn2+ transporter